MDFTYTRYADDLTFSSDSATSPAVGQLLRRVRYLIRQEGFEVHPQKTRVLRRGSRQEVTGVVVNDKPGVDRSTLRRFRAVLHQIEKDGPEGKSWGPGADVLASIMGYADFVAMVDPEKGAPLRARARALGKKHGYKSPLRPSAPKSSKSVADDAGDSPADSEGRGENWWKLW